MTVEYEKDSGKPSPKGYTRYVVAGTIGCLLVCIFVVFCLLAGFILVNPGGMADPWRNALGL